MDSRFGLPALGAILCLAGGGCASEAERQSLASFDRLSRLGYPAAEQPIPAAASQPAGNLLPPRPALGDYLAYAALHNPGLEAAFHRWKAALERIPQARALPDPQFSYRYFIVEQMMRDGDMRHALEIRQMFPWLGKLELRADVAVQEARAEEQRFQAERLKLAAGVKRAYHECYYLGRAIAATRENLELLKGVEGIARARYLTNAATAPDVLRAQVELGKIEDELQSLEDLRRPTVAKLATALNLPADTELPLPEQTPAGSPALSDAQLASWLAESNPELKAMDHMTAREDRAIDLARKDYWPDMEVGFEYDLMADAAGMSGMDMKNPMAVMVGLNIPIWWEKYAAGVREAEARRRAAGRDRLDKHNSLLADLKLAAYNYRNAERKIQLYRDALVPKARQTIQSVRAAYQAGKADFTDLLDSQRTLLEFQLSYERSVADRQQGLAELEMLAGRPLPAAEPSPPASQPATRP